MRCRSFSPRYWGRNGRRNPRQGRGAVLLNEGSWGRARQSGTVVPGCRTRLRMCKRNRTTASKRNSTTALHAYIGNKRSVSRRQHSRSCAIANVVFPIGITQFAFEDLAAGLTRQRVEKLDFLWNLKICKASAQEILHGGRRQRSVRFGLDAGAQPFAEFFVGNTEHRAVARRPYRSARSRFPPDRC
jgi:hypothetical protein